MTPADNCVTGLRGIISAIVTPFDSELKIDHGTLETLAGRVAAGGVHGIMATGGTGEFPHLTPDERLAVIRTIVSAVGDAIPVIAGTAACDLHQTLALAEQAAQAGADAIISVPPFYFPLPDSALVEFFTKLAEGSALPLYVYNNPLYTGNALKPELVVDLLELPNVVGLKQSEGDLGQLVEIIHQARVLRGLDTKLFTGIDSQLTGALASGSDGIFSTAAGIVPRQIVDLFDAAERGDYGEARRLQMLLQPINRFLEYDPGYVAPAKEALSMMGLDVGDPRPPLPLLDESQRSDLRAALTALDVISPVGA
ncbi:MAG: dihydrodipicolinate synthase family protein [Solirubrobacteraceae bacterium]